MTSTIKHLEYDEPVLTYHEIIAGFLAELAPTGGRVVDLGCGPGQILAGVRALRPDLELVGIDGDPTCLGLTADRVDGVETHQADITRPPESIVGRPDVIVSSHSLEHLADPVGALHHWSKLLPFDGRLVVAVPNSHQPLLLARSLGRRPKSNEGHYYIWDRATFDNFCQLAGVEIVDRALDYVPLVNVKTRERFRSITKAERGLLKVVPMFSNSHIVVLRPADRRAD